MRAPHLRIASTGRTALTCAMRYFRWSFVPVVLGLAGLLVTAKIVWTQEFRPEAVSIQLIELSPTHYQLSIASPAVKSEKVETSTGQYDRFTLSDELTIGRPGWPDLPVISRTILIPSTGAVNLKITNISTKEEAGLRPLAAPPADFDDFTSGIPSTEFLSSSGWFPPEPVIVDEPAIMRGYRLVTTYTFPIQYNTATGLTRYNEDVEFDLEFNGIGTNEVSDASRIPPSYSARKALENMVVNPPRFPDRDEILTGNYLYVVPNVNGVDQAITPLIEWRRKMGHSVAVAHVAADANSATIRNTIINAYQSNSPPEFVCLIGDAAGGQVNVAAATETGDYQYTRLDGNDPLPDVAIGRISAASVDQLRAIITKIVSYETNPYMGNADWYRQAMVVAGYSGNGIGEVHLAHWVRMQLEAYGFDEIHSWYWNVNGNAQGNQEFLTDAFRWGISILHYRAFSHMNGLMPAVIANLPNQDGRWPAVLAISCNTGNFVSEQNGNYQGVGMSEEFLRARGGGIGAIGTSTGNTNVRFNNLVAAGVWKGVYQNKMYCLGWGLNQGKYEIWRTYHGFDDGYANFMDWNNLMGDPGTSIWTDVPQRIEVTHLAQTPISSNLVIVDVVDDANGQPVDGAQVCIYRLDRFQVVGNTDENGRAYITMPDNVIAGVASITVVKHNVFPYQGEIDFTEPAQRLKAQNFVIDDDQNDWSRGNDDGDLNPGERIEVGFQLVHPGRNAINGAVNIAITSLSPFVEILDQQIDLDAAPAPGGAIDLLALIQLASSIPDGELIRLQFAIRSNQTTWQSVAEFVVSAPNISIQSLILDGNVLLPSQIKTLDIQVQNQGRLALNPSTATLISNNDAVSVIDRFSTFSRIPINSARALNGGLFRIRAHPLAIPGTKCDLTLIVETEEGFRDSSSFEIVLGQPGAADPFGPDKYGYVCFDSGDENWDMAPEYSWIEINPAINGRRFNGTVLNLTDTGDNQDASIAINLPWNFQYYGLNYRQLTVCSNGWAAFGDQHFIGNFRNQHIAQALAPKAMLAVWWDNLKTIPNTSAIVTYNDRDGGRFIIEWSQMRRLVEAGEGAVETFQIILYDPQQFETVTGDGIITYQYNTVTNENLIAHNDIPYCTIGISSPDGLFGLEYTYWNTYPRGATRIASGMAITFTTQSTTRTGVIEGVITDFESGEPLNRAQVLTTGSFWAETDENGFYSIDDILIGDDYTLTASALGWCDSTLTGFDVAEDETLRVDFSLLHPEIRLSLDRIDRDVHVGRTIDTRLTIHNDGNGSLIWKSVPRVTQEDERPIWEHITSINIGQIADDDRIEGVIFADNFFYLGGANGDAVNSVYKISRNGELVGSFEQAGTARWGYKDLAWDGELIWGSGEDTIFGFTPDGEVVSRFMGQQSPHSALAFDTDRGWLWTSSYTTNIVAVNRQGARVGRIIPRNNLRIYGLSYNPSDPDGKSLYIHTIEPVTSRQIIYRVNPEAGVPELYHVLQPAGLGSPTGTEISSLYDPRNQVYFCVENVAFNEGRDRLDIYQLAPRTDWIRPRPVSGTLAPGQQLDITVSLGAVDLPVLRLDGDLNFIHNAAFGHTSIPVSINTFDGAGPIVERIWALERGWNLVSLNITPQQRNIVELMQPLVDAEALMLVKDGRGRFYNPGVGFNSIPDYDPGQGYQIYVVAAAQMAVPGVLVAADTPIALTAGWNMTAYYPRDPIDAEIALSGLGESLLIAKNIMGRFYIPAYDFNSLGNLSEGNGYQIKVAGDIELIYNVAEEGARLANEPRPLEHFGSVKSTGTNHSLLLIGDPAMSGWEAVVVDPFEKEVGSGRFDQSGRIGLVVWGDNPTTPEFEGLREGDPFIIKLWDGVSETSAQVKALEGDLEWSPDGVTVASIETADSPVEFGLDGAYPNPFNSSTRISFGLPVSSRVTLAVYDLTGREVIRLANGEFGAGRHSIIWQGGRASSGIYIVRLEADGKVLSRKVALIR